MVGGREGGPGGRLSCVSGAFCEAGWSVVYEQHLRTPLPVTDALGRAPPHADGWLREAVRLRELGLYCGRLQLTADLGDLTQVCGVILSACACACGCMYVCVCVCIEDIGREGAAPLLRAGAVY